MCIRDRHYVKNSEIATEAKPRPSRWLFETRGLNDAYYGQSGLARMLEFFPALLSWFFQSFLLVLMPASCYAKFMMGLLMPPEAVQNNRGLPLSFIMASFAECPLCEGRRGERHPFSSPPPRSFFSLERDVYKRQTLRGIIVRKTLSPRTLLVSSTTCWERLVRESNMVNNTPHSSSWGFKKLCTRWKVFINCPRPSRA